MKSYMFLGAATLFAATTLAPVGAQTTGQAQGQNDTQTTGAQTATQPAQTQAAPVQGTSDSSTNAEVGQQGTYATGKPLETQSKEGFWGHVNPLARKKWVNRQVNPIRDRANELDQLQSKNANDIRDVDSRATSGINKAMASANAADAHAGEAENRANQANQLATTANGKTETLNGTVSNLDQYSMVSSHEILFAHGHTLLTKKQKDELGEMASSLGSEKGYIVEVQGYSRGGVASSQAMADSVVRYLVTDENVPVYRIYRTGLGREKAAADNGDKPLTNGVSVTVLHNSLATMGQQSGTPGTPSTTSSVNTNSASPTGANGTAPGANNSATPQ